MSNYKYRQHQILNFLIKQNAPVSSEYLSKAMAISSKTIKKDMSEISAALRSNGAVIQSKTGVGYFLTISDPEAFGRFTNFAKPELSTSNNTPFFFQRCQYIIRRLIAEQRYIKINDLADELYTSRTTITNDMKHVKKILEEFDIRIEQKPNHGLLAIGSERHFRMCLIDQFTHFENNDLFVEETSFSQLFAISPQTFDQIEQVILDAQNFFAPVEIPYQNIKKLVRLIILCSRRNKHDLASSFNEDETVYLMKRSSYQVAKYICNETAPYLDQALTFHDSLLISIYVGCYRNFSSVESIKDTRRFLEYHHLAEDIIKHLSDLNDFLYMKYDASLANNLALHFFPMMQRVNHKVRFDNIPIQHIKQSSPTAVELAIQTATYLKQTRNLDLNENEICFLSLVFYPIFGRYSAKLHRRNIIIVSSINKCTGNIIGERLRRNFSDYIDQITLLDVYELKHFDFSAYDLIFTDLLPKTLIPTPIPIIHISPFFNTSSKDDIKNILMLNHSNFESMILNFKKEYFFNNVHFKEKTEFFRFFIDKLKTKQTLPDGFLEDLIQRDQMCSAEIGNNVALLKTLHSYDLEPFISVTIVEKPFIWLYENVQIIIVWHLGNHNELNARFLESGFFGNVIKSIFGIPDKTMELLQNPNYDQLIELIRKQVDIKSIQDQPHL